MIIVTTYIDINFLDIKKNVLLLKNSTSNIVYVKKYISARQAEIYKYIQQNRFYGIPKIIDVYTENDLVDLE